jgi:hypothetical protein
MRLGWLPFVWLTGCACAPKAVKTEAPATNEAAAEDVVAPTVVDADAKFDAGDCRAAGPMYEAAFAAGPVGIRPRLRAAICRLEGGDRDGALVWLEKAYAAGYPAWAQTLPPRLQALADDARLEALMAKYRDACRDADHRALDFWLGSWDVVDAQGNVVGQNDISAEQDGCLITERWKGTPGDTGQSLNFYDTARKKWRQHWVAKNGAATDYEGELVDGAMKMEGTMVLRDGTPQVVRMTLTPNADGTVVQKIEQSPDGGVSWLVAFEATYRKRAP